MHETGRCVGDHLQARLRLGGEIIELFDDDEISVASKDMGNDEAMIERGEEEVKVGDL